MNSIAKLRESDPHDDFSIAPHVVPSAWADKVLADISRDRKNPSGAGIPTVDTTFRASADDIKVPNIEVPTERPAGPPSTGSGMKSKATVFMFALCSALVAAAWQHYGTAAQQMIAAWTPPFALASSPPQENTGLAGQSGSPAIQASTADQAPPQPASAQPSEETASAAAPSADTQQLQSMARDLAAMGAQIEQLKATVADLKASQQATARDVAKPSEIKPSEAKPVAQNPRPKISALPPRPAAPPPPRRPMPVYAPVQAAAPLPQAPPPPAYMQPQPPPPPAVDRDGEPVMRPPMPLH